MLGRNFGHFGGKKSSSGGTGLLSGCVKCYSGFVKRLSGVIKWSSGWVSGVLFGESDLAIHEWLGWAMGNGFDLNLYL